MTITHRTQEPLAIVGVSYRFPGDHDDDHKLWNLLKTGSLTWGKTPENRFNHDSYYHPNPQRAGSISAEGGHYMNRDPTVFDAPFFGISPAEATALDPQQRFLLETTYECLESAGVPLEKIRGSNTGYFAGAFLKDYDIIISSDYLNVPTYAAVGGAGSFLSNRASWFFDLKGPSFTMDTACSSSLVALHLACQSVWSGECDQALAAGANMILMPNLTRALTQMQFLSPSGRCYSFDERANGYARGEGFAVIMIKPVHDAVRDGDCIRAVIRASAINQNGRTPGITMPSTEAQANLIRTAYKAGGLDFDTTGFFEAHGTGTPIGDPLEFAAIAHTLVNKETREFPLIVGSVKSNIGHLEGTAGLAGLVKAILCVEKGMIPPLADFQKPNPKLRLDDPNLKLATHLTEWPSKGIRRASINSFGAGGTNSHVVIDDAASFLRTHNLKGNHRTILDFSDPSSDSGHGTDSASEDETVAPRIFTFSAPEQAGLPRMALAYAEYLKGVIKEGKHESGSEDFLGQLAQILSTRRSVFDWKTFAIASSATELQAVLRKGLPQFAKPTKASEIAFLFSGQGAQSPQMGTELMHYPIYYQHILAADAYLQSGLGCTWSALEELSRDANSSRIDDAAFAQPLSTILQTALVDLLKSWGIVPKSVVGHSSGEIAAAYSAGIISVEDAWKVAYFRGKFSAAVAERQPDRPGGMLAVGLGESEVAEYLERFQDPGIVIACVNSPHSTTISGPMESINRIAAQFHEDKFYRSTLRVNNAYHSPEMRVICDEYAASIADVKPMDSSGPTMYSSVSGGRISPSEVTAAYWIENMLSKVKFASAVEAMLAPSSTGRGRHRRKVDFDAILEIGPHSALQSPVTQIISAEQEKPNRNLNLSYVSMLRRGINAMETSLQAAGELWALGHKIDLSRVNKSGQTLYSTSLLPELPPYPWNHSDKNKYWHNTPRSNGYRNPKVSRSDILGVLEDDNESTPQFRNYLNLEESPWIMEHKIMGNVVLPATAYISMALEAAMRTADNSKEALRIELRDVIIQRPILFHDQTKAVETRVTLNPHKMGTRLSDAPWTHVVIFSRSLTDDSWNEHASCYFLIHYNSPTSDVEGISEELRHGQTYKDKYLGFKESCTYKASISTIYLALEDNGLNYGPVFQNLKDVHCGGQAAVGTVRIPDTKALMPKNVETPHLIHPVTLDSITHLTLPALRNSGLKSSTLIPVAMESVIVDLSIPSTPGAELKGYASYQMRGFHDLMTEIVMSEGDFTKPLVTIKNLFCQQVAGMMSLGTDSAPQIKPIATELTWKEDIDLLQPHALEEALDRSRRNSSGAARLIDCFVELAHAQSFKSPWYTVLELGATGPELATCTIQRLSDRGRVPRIDKYIAATLGSNPKWIADLLKEHSSLVEHQRFDHTSGSSDEVPFENGSINAVSCFNLALNSTELEPTARLAYQLLKPQGKFCFTVEASTLSKAEMDLLLRQIGFSGVDVLLEDKLTFPPAIFVTTTKALELTPIPERDIVFVQPLQHDSRVLALMNGVEEQLVANGHRVARATIGSLPDTEDKTLICFLGLGDFSLNGMTLGEFTAWREMLLRNSGLMWVSVGATRPDKNPLHSMITGALRVVRSENIASRIVHFDYSEDMDLVSTAATNLLLDAAKASLFAPVGAECETEMMESEGNICIPRLLRHDDTNLALYYDGHYASTKTQKIKDLKSDAFQLRIGTAGMLDTLRFETVENFPKTLPVGSAKVRVTATPINFVDIMVAMGVVPAMSLGCECAGIVEEVHPGSKYKIGDQVVVLTSNAFATYVIEDESLMQAIPDSMTPAAAASCATIYVTAYVALVDVGRLQKGEKILIHAGAGGLGQAAIQLSKMVGAEIFVTVGSVAKKALLMEKYGIPEDHIFNSRDLTFAKGIMRQTDQQGVDVILNSSSGETLRQTWHCIAPFGRFLEVGKRDILMNTGLDMTPFLRNVSYHGVHIDQMTGSYRHLIASAMQKVFDLIKTGCIGEVHPVKTMTYSQIEEGFRLVQAGKHTGKIVLVQSDEDVVQVIPPTVEKLALDPQATYVIAGGLGGVGQSTVDSMFECGGRNFAFFSRSGDSRPEAQEYLTNLKRRGANAKAYRADISNFEDLSVAVELMNQEMPPVKGFLNSAMNLQDAMFSNMTYEQWSNCLPSKVEGTWNFHELLPKGLDFFIMLSSISAIIGNTGQANYAASCTYQDALAFYRRSIGERAVSINLSAIYGVGVLEVKKDTRSAYYDYIAISEIETVVLLGCAMKGETVLNSPFPTQLTTGVNPTMLNVGEMHWCNDPKFRIIKREGEGRGVSLDDDTSKSKLIDDLQQCTSLSAVARTIESSFVLKLSKIMSCAPEDINTQKPLHSFGVDSLLAMEVRNWIFKELKSEVTIFDIMDPQPFSALCYRIGEKSKLISAEVKAKTGEAE